MGEMNEFLDRINTRVGAIAVTAVLVVAALVVFGGGDEEKTVTAHFSRAVAVYPGSEVRLMGVPIGTITKIVPEGESVRVEMKYDGKYRLPEDAKAAIVTPTLVSDRYVQLAPAYTAGKELRDGADIPMERTGSPVELDRIYRSLADLSDALGPNGANKQGALSGLLASGADALRGKGQLANKTILSMSKAVETFGNNSGELFDTVSQLAQITEVLARNDNVVNSFMSNLTGVSAQLAAQRSDLRQALVALSGVMESVRGFVHDNRAALTSNVQGLASVFGAVAKEQEALGSALQLGPLGLGNLALAFDPKSGSIGSRMQLGPTGMSLGNVLCDIVVNGKIPNAQLACTLLRAITGAVPNTDIGAGTAAGAPRLGTARSNSGLGGLLGVTP